MLRSDLVRLLHILTAPRSGFEDVRRRPTFAAALIALVVCGGLSMAVVLSKTDVSSLIRAAGEAGQSVDRAAMEQSAAILYRFRWLAIAASALILAPATYLLTALLFFVVFRIQGAGLTLRRSLAVTVHGLLPSCVQAALAVGIAIWWKTVPMDGHRSLVASNLAVFASEGASPSLLALLLAIDLFSLWALALLCLGFSVAADIPRRQAVATVVACWAVYVAGKVLLAAA